MRAVESIRVWAASIASLSLPDLETMGFLTLLLDDSLEELDLPSLTYLGRLFLPNQEDTPLLDAPLLAEVGTLSLSYSSGDLMFSLPALETAGHLGFLGHGFMSLSLPALSEASTLSVSDTLLTSVPIIPRGVGAASITNVGFSDNTLLSECAIRLLCEEIVNNEVCFVSDNLGCAEGLSCSGGVCQ